MPEAGETVGRFNRRGVVFWAIAGTMLLSAGTASAISSHDPWKLRQVRIDGLPLGSASGQCENCHTLDPDEGEPLTSYINRTAQTMSRMRAFGGIPVTFGCTFCHSDVTDNIYM